VNFFSEPIITKATVLLTDSRFVSQPQQSIFFAIKGERHDGHNFIEELYEKGVREFVVEKKATKPDLNECFPEAKFWLVENGIRALQNLAAVHRKKFNIPIIGITGSNGKNHCKRVAEYFISKRLYHY
jgi:Alr-MurF fusion protein